MFKIIQAILKYRIIVRIPITFDSLILKSKYTSISVIIISRRIIINRWLVMVFITSHTYYNYTRIMVFCGSLIYRKLLLNQNKNTKKKIAQSLR